MSNTSCITHIHLCFRALISGHVRISFVFFPLLFLVYSDPKNRFMHHLWTPLGSRPFGLTNFKDRSKDPTGSSSSVSSSVKNKMQWSKCHCKNACVLLYCYKYISSLFFTLTPGVGIGIVDLGIERRLANQLGAHRAPSIIGLVNGRVTFFHQAVVREHLRQFIEDLLPQKLVEKVNAADSLLRTRTLLRLHVRYRQRS